MINTFSSFYYGHEVTALNYNLPFDEGSGELNAEVDIGSYTFEEFVSAVQTALNIASIIRTFTLTYDRETRLVTISADGNFDLLVLTGTTTGSSVFELLGFTGSSDLTGLSSYTGVSPSGFEYNPQFMLQSYVDKEDYQESASASVNQAASGKVEVVRFGVNQFYEFDIKFITNLPMDGTAIKNNSTGVEDARNFLKYITKRNRFEFMPDINNKNIFDKVVLESIPGNNTATGYKLRELFGQNLPNIYETGTIRLRVVF